MDEARFGQQGTLTTVWARRGSRPVRVRQCQYDWVYLYGAVDPQTGQTVGMLAPTVNTAWMSAFLQLVSDQAEADEHLVLVLDNAGWHVARELKVPANITLLYLPPYSPELNPIERLWKYLKEHYLSNRVYSDYDALVEAATEAFRRPTAEDIKSICRTAWLERRN